MIINDERKELDLAVDHLNNKKDVRDFLLQTWSKEEAGVQFRYFVETLSDNKKIYLERPANLNKGCDFVIKIEGLFVFKNNNDKPPKHENLLKYIETNKSKLINLKNELNDIYNCRHVEITYINIEHEIILKLSKWFFIEQDITYWAKSGRAMLWEAIQDKL